MNVNKKQPLELRHQRTSHVYFVLYGDINRKSIYLLTVVDCKGQECVYRVK
jgi:hypothetical protein